MFRLYKSSEFNVHVRERERWKETGAPPSEYNGSYDLARSELEGAWVEHYCCCRRTVVLFFVVLVLCGRDHGVRGMHASACFHPNTVRTSTRTSTRTLNNGETQRSLSATLNLRHWLVGLSLRHCLVRQDYKQRLSLRIYLPFYFDGINTYYDQAGFVLETRTELRGFIIYKVTTI